MELHDDLLTSVPVKTPKGREGGRIYVVATDFGLHKRLVETQDAFLDVLSRLGEVNITPDGNGADATSEGVVEAASQSFSDLLNYVCGTQTGPEAFAQYRPFSILRGGVFWATRVMEALDEARKLVETNIKQISKEARDWR